MLSVNIRCTLNSPDLVRVQNEQTEAGKPELVSI